MLVFNASGELLPPCSVASIVAFVAPLAESGTQLTLISGRLNTAASEQFIPAYVVIPVPLRTGTQMTSGAGRAVDTFLAALTACFPSTEPVPAPQAEPEPDDAQGGTAASSSALGAYVASMEPSSLMFPFGSSSGPSVPSTVHVHAVGSLAAAAVAGHVTLPALASAFAMMASQYGPSFGACVVQLLVPTRTSPPFHVACTHSLAQHAATGRPALYVPIGAAGVRPEAAAAGFSRCDLRVYSVGTVRRADWHGGGKTSSEMTEDIRHRFASGSFRALREATTSWAALRGSSTAPPAIRMLFTSTAASAAGSQGVGGAVGKPPLSQAVRIMPHGDGVAADTGALNPAGSGVVPASLMQAAPLGVGSLARAGSHVSFSATALGAHHDPRGQRALIPPGVVDVLRLRKAAALPAEDLLLFLDDGVRHAEDEDDD
jgi:hypothetical protein